MSGSVHHHHFSAAPAAPTYLMTSGGNPYPTGGQSTMMAPNPPPPLPNPVPQPSVDATAHHHHQHQHQHQHHSSHHTTVYHASHHHSHQHHHLKHSGNSGVSGMGSPRGGGGGGWTRRGPCPRGKDIVRFLEGQDIEDFYALGETLSISGGLNDKKRPTLKEAFDAYGEERIIKVVKKESFRTPLDEKKWRYVHSRLLRLPPHENLLHLIEIFESDNEYYVVMEKCHGGELFDFLLTAKSVPEEECKHIIRQILKAIRHLHQFGLLHRDVKPENLVFKISNSKNLLLLDFDTVIPLDGYAADILDEERRTGPHPKRLAGTHGYLPLEVYEGYPFGQQVDVWAVGVILYILMAAVPPCPMEQMTNSKEALAILRKTREKGIDWTRGPWEEFPEALDLCKQLLTWEPEKRPTAGDALQHAWLLETETSNLLFPPEPPRAPIEPSGCSLPAAYHPNNPTARRYGFVPDPSGPCPCVYCRRSRAIKDGIPEHEMDVDDVFEKRLGKRDNTRASLDRGASTEIGDDAPSALRSTDQLSSGSPSAASSSLHLSQRSVGAGAGRGWNQWSNWPNPRVPGSPSSPGRPPKFGARPPPSPLPIGKIARNLRPRRSGAGADAGGGSSIGSLRVSGYEAGVSSGMDGSPATHYAGRGDGEDVYEGAQQEYAEDDGDYGYHEYANSPGMLIDNSPSHAYPTSLHGHTNHPQHTYNLRTSSRSRGMDQSVAGGPSGTLPYPYNMPKSAGGPMHMVGSNGDGGQGARSNKWLRMFRGGGQSGGQSRRP
ncbi:unnamed protein product [Vitrella brassicaformis CCMP3155]|uniref:Protein kinase domain-containing protein n=1 Tax=Vitrella brassicaformis (strain CCMP3155) TaxID=1169540 RepID=A0A0G4FR15_VITBC|nr:unnamed protein product [Vitrella brassicaformis CCMP3155]|mmetsp:Transcript_18065/g.43514  ORF Transcript_18065/g.43514 Transcript_18065/m.43514 type:complete len:774 (-) Transcript_18065:360-2681(-)|eukprot:CEM16898.1 unnamed protein product [Vitrella brassicaformis CCMP3155]